MDYANWMNNLPPESKQRPLSDLLLPGTHHSAAYQRRRDIVWSETDLGTTGWLIGLESNVDSWVKTQTYDIYRQLEHGIRFLDLMVSYHSPTQTFYCSHTYALLPLEAAFNQINTFRARHHGEIIVVRLRADPAHTLTTNEIEQIFQLVHDTFILHCIINECENTLTSEMTLSYYQSKHLQMLFQWEGDTKIEVLPPYIWNMEHSDFLFTGTRIIGEIPYSSEKWNTVIVSSGLIQFNPWWDWPDDTLELSSELNKHLINSWNTLTLDGMNAVMVDNPSRQLIALIVGYNL